MKPFTSLGSFLCHLLYAPDAAPGLSVTGDAELDTAVMGRLGVEMETPVERGTRSAEPGKEKKAEDQGGAGETPEQQAERAAAEAETARVEELVKTTGKTKEDILAEEAAAADTAAAEREAQVTALIEAGKTPEEAEAEIVAEEEAAAAAVQTPELTEEVKTWHEAQIAAKDEELAAATAKMAEAEAKVTELEAQLQANGTQPLAIAPIDPLFLIDDPAQLDVEAGKLKAFETWLLKNWDGVEAVEASADGKTKATPAYPAEQIRARYAQIKELREEILPAARQGIQARKAHEAQARKAYPELFDAKRPEFRVAENILKLAPGLKAIIPNIHIVIGDSLRGEKIRRAEEKARATKTKVTVKPPVKIVKPGGGAGAAKVQSPPSKGGSKAGEVLDTAKFTKAMEAGGTGRAALVAALT